MNRRYRLRHLVARPNPSNRTFCGKRAAHVVTTINVEHATCPDCLGAVR